MPTLVASLTDDDVRIMIAMRPRTLTGVRDSALVAVAYDAALFMREVVALNVQDLEIRTSGIYVTSERARRDAFMLARTGEPGRCPSTLLEHWLEEASLVDGPLFVPVVGRYARRGIRLHPDLAQAALRRAAADADVVTIANEAHLP